MKKALLASAALLAIGYAHSAFADVDVTVLVSKDKNISVTENIDITKIINVTVSVENSVTKAAEVDSLINQANFDNEACENCAEKLDQIIDSVNLNTGVYTVNQSSGNNNNQGSVLTAAVDVIEQPNGDNGDNGTNGFLGFAEAQGAIDQRNGVDEEGVSMPNLVDSGNIIFRDGVISGSISDNTGVVMVNQAPGQMLNQANNVAIAVSLDPHGGVALSEADLGQETSTNANHESEVTKVGDILNSVNGNTGVTLVNQGVGNMSNQANLLTVAAVTAVTASVGLQ